jgi:hypothetical protein
MKKFSVTTTWNLRQLCIDHNWFTCGSIEQYEKLFYANEHGCPIEEIATIIWLCSDDECRRADVLDILETAFDQHVMDVIEEHGDREKLLHITIADLYDSYFD